jgi:hypothetical protein
MIQSWDGNERAIWGHRSNLHVLHRSVTVRCRPRRQMPVDVVLVIMINDSIYFPVGAGALFNTTYVRLIVTRATWLHSPSHPYIVHHVSILYCACPSGISPSLSRQSCCQVSVCVYHNAFLTDSVSQSAVRNAPSVCPTHTIPN